MLGRDLLEGHFRARSQAFAVTLFELLDMLLERRRLLQRMAQVKADDAQRQRQEKRQAPAPLKELRLAQHRGNQHHHPSAQDEACNRAEVQPAAEKAALAVRRILGDEDRGAGVLTAHREALGHLGQQQQDRRPDADRGIGRYQANGKGTERHDHDGRGKHFLSPELVAQRTEEQPAQRTDQERHRERGQGGDHLHAGVGVGEEHFAERIGNKTVDAEVEPLHGVAQCRGSDRLAHLGVVDDGDVAQADRLDAFLA
ncbi:hypothetical protein D3C76_868460 [compost metagenome]